TERNTNERGADNDGCHDDRERQRAESKEQPRTSCARADYVVMPRVGDGVALDKQPMNLAIAILIVVAATGVAIVAMLWVRRRAPDGSYFHDGDRAAGVFGVLATGFSVLLGFVVFLAFSSYDAARAGAESEAQIVAQQVETAQLLPPAVSGKLTRQLVCYARS